MLTAKEMYDLIMFIIKGINHNKQPFQNLPNELGQKSLCYQCIKFVKEVPTLH